MGLRFGHEGGVPTDDEWHRRSAGGTWPIRGDAAETQAVGAPSPEARLVPRVLLRVYRALQERGYDPVGQIAQYLLSGEPTYITAHRGARALIVCVERDVVLAELVRAYLAAPPPRR